MVLGNGTSYEYDNFSWKNYDIQAGQYNSPVLGSIDKEQPIDTWYRHCISFAELGMTGMTYADLKNNGLDEIRMQIINQSTSVIPRLLHNRPSSRRIPPRSAPANLL